MVAQSYLAMVYSKVENYLDEGGLYLGWAVGVLVSS